MNHVLSLRMRVAALSLLVLVLTAAAPTRAATVIGQETDSGGFVGAITTGVPPSPQIWFASDGEAGFHPFGAPFDLTDAIQFTAGTGWVSDMPATTNWTQITGADQVTGNPNPDTWVLPAISENEPSFNEDVGRWVFSPGGQWAVGSTGTFVILSAAGDISDVIVLANDGPGGEASISFSSDPIASVPLPASAWGGIVLLAALAIRKRMARVAV